MELHPQPLVKWEVILSATLSAFGGDFSFTLGSRNLFDREAQGTPMPAGIVAELQDPRGRLFYARMVVDF